MGAAFVASGFFGSLVSPSFSAAWVIWGSYPGGIAELQGDVSQGVRSPRSRVNVQGIRSMSCLEACA